MMKDKNKGKKTFAAVGAVVAAGLTPGFVVASAAGLPNQNPNAGITAADVVAIAGNAYGFDELYAMQRGDTVETVIELPDIILQPNNATLYGAPVVLPYKPAKKVVQKKDNTIYHVVEQEPRFPGGEAALMKYIQSHLNYPKNAAKNNIEGRVVVQMVIDSSGKVGKVKVVHSVHKDLDKEAIRVVKSLPKFTPGRKNGNAVNVWYTLPVPFKLK